MLELILVRHGETNHPLTNQYIGITNEALGERGKKQALSLARTFVREKLDAIYTSPLDRAKDTAEPIANSLRMDMEILTSLCDRNYGIWEGKSPEEIRDKFPEENEQWYQNWFEYEIPQGESAKQVYERNVEAIQKILEKHESGKILIVTHQVCIRNILSILFEMSVDGGWHFQANHAGICRVRFDEFGCAMMTSFNEI